MGPPLPAVSVSDVHLTPICVGNVNMGLPLPDVNSVHLNQTCAGCETLELSSFECRTVLLFKCHTPPPLQKKTGNMAIHGVNTNGVWCLIKVGDITDGAFHGYISLTLLHCSLLPPSS